ncbi:MAG: HNH endonuclease [Candidatus Thorarchaeota archaeon]
MKIIIALNCDEIKVSDCDYLFLSGYNWSYQQQWGYYQCSNRDVWNGQQINGRPIHWFVAQLMQLEVPKGYSIDHIDRDKSNNQRNNLRVSSRRLQVINRDIQSNNTSGFTGVRFRKHCKIHPWEARITLLTGPKYLGHFSTLEEAFEVYQKEKEIRDNEFS